MTGPMPGIARATMPAIKPAIPPIAAFSPVSSVLPVSVMGPRFGVSCDVSVTSLLLLATTLISSREKPSRISSETADSARSRRREEADNRMSQYIRHTQWTSIFRAL